MSTLEKVFSINWDYDFHQHDWDHGGSMNPEVIKDNVQMLKELEKGFQKGIVYRATNDSGSPKCGWGTVVRVEMLAVWPYDCLIPTIVIEKISPLNGKLIEESFSFTSLSAIQRL